MIESLVNSSTISEPKNSSWNYVSFEIADPLGFHSRPVMWVHDAGLFCPGKIQIALSNNGEDPASARYIETRSIMDMLLYAANSAGRILNVRYGANCKEIDKALGSIREGMAIVWPKNVGRRYD